MSPPLTLAGTTVSTRSFVWPPIELSVTTSLPLASTLTSAACATAGTAQSAATMHKHIATREIPHRPSLEPIRPLP